MKRITIVTSYPINAEPVIKNRLQPYIDVLIQHGFTVTLISGDYETPVFSFEHEVNFLYVPKPDVQGVGFFSRAMQEFKHANQLLKLVNYQKADCVLLTIPSMFLLFRSGILKHSRKVIDVRDLTWEYLSSDKLTFLCVKKILSWFAKQKFGRFSLVAVTNTTEFSKMECYYGLNPQQLHMLPNGVSKQQFDILSNSNRSKNSKPTICYIGNVGVAQNLTLLVDVATRCPEVDFLIVGGGNDFNRVKKYVHDKNVKNVEMTGRVSWDSIPSYYEQADILFAQLGSDYKGAMPSKLYEYLASRKFIIYGGCAQAAEVLAEFDNNIVIQPDSIDALHQAVCEALKRLSKNYLSNLNRDKIKSMYIREDNISVFVEKLEGLL